MTAYDGHRWRDDDGHPWSPWNTVNDRCRAVLPDGSTCGQPPVAHERTHTLPNHGIVKAARVGAHTPIGDAHPRWRSGHHRLVAVGSVIYRLAVTVAALVVFASLFLPDVRSALGLTVGEAAILAWVLVIAVDVSAMLDHLRKKVEHG